uniref:7TM_GPCR_Srx domain-containing protein n=1 Tax=Panagrellus redivivus TaxID=6233 RepID=A0A7E4UY90_PANRE
MAFTTSVISPLITSFGGFIVSVFTLYMFSSIATLITKSTSHPISEISSCMAVYVVVEINSIVLKTLFIMMMFDFLPHISYVGISKIFGIDVSLDGPYSAVVSAADNFCCACLYYKSIKRRYFHSHNEVRPGGQLPAVTIT